MKTHSSNASGAKSLAGNFREGDEVAMSGRFLIHRRRELVFSSMRERKSLASRKISHG